MKKNSSLTIPDIIERLKEMEKQTELSYRILKLRKELEGEEVSNGTRAGITRAELNRSIERKKG